MDAQFERRLLLAMNGRNSLSAHHSPLQSPIKSSDRYIPLRSSLSASNLHYQMNTTSSSTIRKIHSSSTNTSPNKKCKYEQNSIGLSSGVTASQPDLSVYEQLLQNTLLNTNNDSIPTLADVSTTKTVNESDSSATILDKSHSIFHYSERRSNSQFISNSINKHHLSRSPISNASVHLLYSPKKTIRHIPEVPYKVLDAPDLQDDFYLNLIDWSPSNILGVGLSACVYVYNAQSNQVQLLTDLSQTPLPSTNHQHLNIIGSDTVTSVHWSEWSNVLAVGK
jgi:cell division cycle 20-like protein 1, cofactor of APC complex